MNKEEIIKRFEGQIEELLDTLVELDKYEQKEPIRELSNWHKKALGMCFFGQVLSKSLWYKLKDKGLKAEQHIEIITTIANTTREHFLSLYGYDSYEDTI